MRSHNDSDFSLQGIDMNDEELSSVIDSILRESDINNDGYIDYYEFVLAQRKNRGNDA